MINKLIVNHLSPSTTTNCRLPSTNYQLPHRQHFHASGILHLHRFACKALLLKDRISGSISFTFFYWPLHILFVVWPMIVLCSFYLYSKFDHGSRRVWPWFDHIFGANTMQILPNIHAYITHLYRYVIYAWYIRDIYVIYTWYISGNHGRTLLEPWSNREHA